MSVPRDAVVVLPVYNEASVLGSVVAGLRTAFDVVVCVDDGSVDGSAEIAAASGGTVLRHPTNLGQGAALQTGLTYATLHPGTSHVITFDADGQHRVSDAVAMLEVARSTGVDVVLGSRFLTPTTHAVPLARRLVLRGAVGFTRWTTRMPVTDTHNGLRVLSRRAAASIDLTLNGMAHASQLLDQVARERLSWTEHPVTVDYTDYSRAKGQSNLNAVNIAFDLLGARLRTGR